MEGGDGDQDGDPIRLVMAGIEARPRHILRILDWVHASPAASWRNVTINVADTSHELRNNSADELRQPGSRVREISRVSRLSQI